MENVFKFSNYEVFAYLAAGLALMVGVDVVLGWETILRRDGDMSLADGAIRLLIAYVLGFLLDQWSAWILQRIFANRIIGNPFGFLLRKGDGNASGWRGWRLAHWLLGNYHDAASAVVRTGVIGKLSKAPGWAADDVESVQTPPNGWVRAAWKGLAENVFFTAHPTATRDALAQGRMEMFLKLYGFCRNLGFVLLLCAIGFFAQWLRGEGAPQLGRASGSGSGVTVVVVPTEATAARVSEVLKEAMPKPCGPFATNDKGSSAPGCNALTLPSHGWLALGSALVAILLILRFLHFHRLYALEVLTAYSRDGNKPPATGQLAAAAATFLTAVAATKID